MSVAFPDYQHIYFIFDDTDMNKSKYRDTKERSQSPANNALRNTERTNIEKLQQIY